MGVLRSGAHACYEPAGDLSSGVHVRKVPRCLHGVGQTLVPAGVLATIMDLGPCMCFRERWKPLWYFEL